MGTPPGEGHQPEIDRPLELSRRGPGAAPRCLRRGPPLEATVSLPGTSPGHPRREKSADSSDEREPPRGEPGASPKPDDRGAGCGRTGPEPHSSTGPSV